MAVNEPRPEGIARGGGLFTSHKRSNYYGLYILLVVLETKAKQEIYVHNS